MIPINVTEQKKFQRKKILLFDEGSRLSKCDPFESKWLHFCTQCLTIDWSKLFTRPHHYNFSDAQEFKNLIKLNIFEFSITVNGLENISHMIYGIVCIQKHLYFIKAVLIRNVHEVTWELLYAYDYNLSRCPDKATPFWKIWTSRLGAPPLSRFCRIVQILTF